jgi:iron complex outermembrane recepter protein
VGGRLGLGAAATTPAGRAQAAAAYAASGDVGDFHDTNQDFSPSLSDVYSWGTSGTLTWTLSDNLEAKSISAYRVADRMTFYDLDGSPFPILHTNGYTHQEVFSQELQLAGDAVDGRLNWIIGGYYSREFGFDGTQSISLNSFATRSFNEGHVTNKSIAGFGQATFNITDQFGITAGLRYTEEEKRLVSANRRLDGLCNLPVDLRLPGQCLVIRDDTWDALNYSFSLDYKPVDGVLLYAKTSTGFRSGGHNLRGGIDPITFETFDPEHVTDYEIGLKGDWLDGRLRTNLAAYYTKYKDIQRAVLVPSTLNPSSTVVRNAARATIYGGEAEVTFIPVDNLTLRATAGLTEPEYEEYRDGLGVDLSDQPFTYIPDRTYSLSAAYVMPMESGDLRFQVDWAWRGRVYYDDDSLFNGTNGLPDLRGQDAFGLLNARVSKRYESLGLDIALYGKNILDEEYIAGNLDTSTTALGFNSAVPGEPAIWGLEITKRFP